MKTSSASMLGIKVKAKADGTYPDAAHQACAVAVVAVIAGSQAAKSTTPKAHHTAAVELPACVALGVDPCVEPRACGERSNRHKKRRKGHRGQPHIRCHSGMSAPRPVDLRSDA